MSSQDKPPVSIRIRLKYPDVETFIDKYATNISRGGMFIQSRVPQPVGTELRFEVLLQDDSPLLRGEGTVIWVKEYDAAHPTRVHGMGVRFTELDEPSLEMVERVLSAKSGSPRARSETQEVRALVNEAAAAEQEELLEANADEDDEDGQATTVQPLAAFEAEPPVEPVPAAPPRPLEPVPAAAPPVELAPAAATPFATLIAEAAPAEPIRTSSEELAALAEVLEGGDGVSVALAMAEQVLGEICSAAGLGEEQIAATLAAATRASAPAQAGGSADELEALLAPAPLPAITLEEAQSGLAAHGLTHRSLAPAPAPARPTVAAPSVAAPSVAAPPVAAPPVAQPPAAAPLAAAPLAVQGFVPEAERDFDPSLLRAAARAARAAKQERSTGNFDLSDGRVATGEFRLDEASALAATPEPAAAVDPGWRKLQTVTELLDHGSSEVLQDMAQLAGRHELTETRSERAEPSFVEEAPAAEATELATGGEDEVVELEAARAVPEEAQTEPLLDPESVDELSQEIWKEVVDEAAEELDRLEIPLDAGGDTAISPAARDDAFFPGDSNSSEELSGEDLLTSEDLERELSAPQRAFGDGELEDEDLGDDSESTQVTAMPVFADRAPARFVEAEPDTFETEREPDLLEAELGLEGASEIEEAAPLAELEDALPPDPDLSSEVFETLAGLRDTLRERSSEGEPAPSSPTTSAPDDLDIPSLEALAGAHSPPPPRAPAPEPAPRDPDSLEVLATDPDAPEPKPEIKPRRGGIFRRIFGKKEP